MLRLRRRIWGTVQWIRAPLLRRKRMRVLNERLADLRRRQRLIAPSMRRLLKPFDEMANRSGLPSSNSAMAPLNQARANIRKRARSEAVRIKEEIRLVRLELQRLNRKEKK